MSKLKQALFLLVLVLLVAGAAAYRQLGQPTAEPVQVAMAPAAAPSPTSEPFPSGITNEPLTVVMTLPADKAEQVAVAKGTTRIVVQFNHPVVPLVGVEQQKDLPQPLSFQPAISGEGNWVNTSTYAFTPNQNLTIAAEYKVTVGALKDMLGQSLNGFSWTFKTAPPAILKMSPADNTQYVGATQPISMTFNTEMDRSSTESRFTVTRKDQTTAIPGKFDWQGTELHFIPEKPFEYSASYTAQLKAGAQDVTKSAGTAEDTTWTFTTTSKPAVASTTPANGERNVKLQNGFRIQFTAPMNEDGLKITIQPTITNQNIWWEGNRFGEEGTNITARLNGNFFASQAYTVTISAKSTTRYGEELGKDYVVKFSTAPRDPSLYLNVPGNMAMYDTGAPQSIVTSFVNINQIDYKLYKVDRAEYLGLIGRNMGQTIQKYAPKQSNRLRAWSLKPAAALNVTRLISTTLTADGSSLAPGVYLLDATSPTIQSSNGTQGRHLLVVTDLNLALKRTETEALVWVTGLASGKPVADQPLALYDTNGRQLGSGKSDKDGVWRVSFARQNPWDAIYVVSDNGGQLVGAVGSDWNSGIMSWDFNLQSQVQASDYYANLYTDRAIYRPGQTVYFRGILRSDNDAVYSLPEGVETVPIIVRDAQGKQISKVDALLSRFGTFNGQVELSAAASIGYYNVSFTIGPSDREFNSSVGFQVAEYRAPEFQVETKSDKPEYINGETIKVDVNSSYFFGGPVTDAPVQWRLLSDDYFFNPQNVKGYWSFTDYDLVEQRQHQGGVIREGKGKTDAAGNFHFQVPADLKDFPLSQNFTLEVQVTDVNNQAVSSRVVVPVHKGQYYIGLKPQRYVGTVNEEQAVDVLTVDPKGEPVANQQLAVSFFEHKWYSVREKQDNGSFYWRSAYTDTLVSKVNVTTDAKGMAEAKFTPTVGGVYKIVAEGQDSAKNNIRSATYLWVSGHEFVNWRMENNDRIDLVADKKEYAPGDTAEILIPAPFKDSQALLTIERGSFRDVQQISLPSNSEKIKIPIQSDYAPNVFVSVFLVKGRGADSPLPQFKLGYTNLSVSTVEKQLTVNVTPDKTTHYGPGDKAGFTIQATDSKGKPVEAEFSVALVDKAIQSLADDTAPSPEAAFYGERGLGVQTAATLVRSVERINQTLTPEAKGGGGGLLQQSVRRDFRDTAYWKADVVTDASGKAQVSIPLPDNLTTWNLTAKGVTVSTLVGVGKTDIVSTKDLLVRPSLPRFFVVGDKAHLEAVVNNNSDQDVSTDVTIEAQGLTVAGNKSQPLTIRAHDKAKVGWDTTVGAVSQVMAKFSVAGGGFQDAIEQTLPVRRPTSAETVATAGQVDTKSAEQIQLPQSVDPSAGELRVELSPSLAAASQSSLTYLDAFDYECSEQTVSKFLPNVATYLALKKFGIDRPDLKAGLESNVALQVQRLYALQRPDGGWGWWLEDESKPTLTAYALFGLYNARSAGFAVDSNVMNRAEQFLTRYLDKPMDVNASYAPNERAFVLFVLSEMGRNQSGRLVSLFDQRTNLAVYGKAFLLMGLQKQKQPQATTLATEIESAAIVSATGAHWEEAKQDYWTMNTNTRTTALAIMALSRMGQGTPSATLANGVRWLMVARKDGHWETTQETAWSVLGLTEFMQATGELQGNYAYQVSFNGKPLGDGKIDKSNVDQSKTFTVAIKDMVTNAANDLVITRDGTAGKLYYSAYLDYYLPVENMQPLNKGIIVARQYEAVDPRTLKPTGKLVTSANVGDYVQVTLTLVAPNDLHYLALEDPLPAGFEAVDTTLKTSSVAASSPELKDATAAAKEDFWARPYWYYWAHSEVRDDRVAAFATYLARGTYEYSYMMRASVPGEFRALPARAWEMYFPEVFGRSAGAAFSIGQ